MTAVVATAAAEQAQILHPVPGTPSAAEFSLLDIDAKRHTLSAYKGKVVVVNFWATWCPPCREELPSMQRMHEQLMNENIVLLAIDVGEDADTIFTFTADYPVSFPLLMDTDSKVIKAYPVVGLPTTFVIDPAGRLAYRAIGSRRWDNKAIISILRGLAH